MKPSAWGWDSLSSPRYKHGCKLPANGSNYAPCGCNWTSVFQRWDQKWSPDEWSFKQFLLKIFPLCKWPISQLSLWTSETRQIVCSARFESLTYQTRFSSFFFHASIYCDLNKHAHTHMLKHTNTLTQTDIHKLNDDSVNLLKQNADWYCQKLIHVHPDHKIALISLPSSFFLTN